MNMTDSVQNVLKSKKPNKENVAFTRYADRVEDEQFQAHFQFPRGQPLERINPAVLFKVSKTDQHWAQVRRSKAFIADDFFPPIQMPNDVTVKEILA